MFLIDSIILAPLKGVIWVGEKLHGAAVKDFSDEGKIKEELMKLQLQFELDEINEEEYTKEENKLLERLEASRKMKEEGS